MGINVEERRRILKRWLDKIAFFIIMADVYLYILYDLD